MILRRIKGHVEKENWFAVALDFCIVVLGILIAFQITNWNERRADAALADDLIARMSAEAVATRGELGAYIEDHQKIQGDAMELAISLRELDSCLAMDDRLKILIVSIADFPPPRFSLPNAQQALDTGSLSLIRSNDIRESIQVMTDEMVFIDRQWQRYINVKQYAHEQINRAAGTTLTTTGLIDFGETLVYNPKSYEVLTPENVCANAETLSLASDIAVTQTIYVTYLEQVKDALDLYLTTLKAGAP